MFQMNSKSKNSGYPLTEEERVYFAIRFNTLGDQTALSDLADLVKARGKPLVGDAKQVISNMPGKITRAIANGDVTMKRLLAKFGIDSSLPGDQQDKGVIEAACASYIP